MCSWVCRRLLLRYTIQQFGGACQALFRQFVKIPLIRFDNAASTSKIALVKYAVNTDREIPWTIQTGVTLVVSTLIIKLGCAPRWLGAFDIAPNCFVFGWLCC